MSLACDAMLEPDLPIAERLAQMLSSAIVGAVGSDLPSNAYRHSECFIGLPEPRQGLPTEIWRSVATSISSTFGFAAPAVQVLQHGHASGLMAIQMAAQKITRGDADFCVVAGVDSYHDPDTLRWLDEQGMLMSPANRNGFPPGEGAGACLLTSRAGADRHGLPILSRVAAAATSFEPNAIRGDDVCIGNGLTAALRSVISSLRLPEQPISSTYCDLNGERYRNEEFVYTLLRVQEAFVDAHDYECPADCWGDMGAASGPLFACLAIAANQRAYSKGPHPLLWAGSESGHRAAVVLAMDAD